MFSFVLASQDQHTRALHFPAAYTWTRHKRDDARLLSRAQLGGVASEAAVSATPVECGVIAASDVLARAHVPTRATPANPPDANLVSHSHHVFCCRKSWASSKQNCPSASGNVSHIRAKSSRRQRLPSVALETRNLDCRVIELSVASR